MARVPLSCHSESAGTTLETPADGVDPPAVQQPTKPVLTDGAAGRAGAEAHVLLVLVAVAAALFFA